MKTNTFKKNDLVAFEPTEKVGLLATVSAEGLPHITLITSLQAKDETTMMWGQFTEGFSKKHVKTNPKTGFLILTMDRKLWRGKATYTHATTEGEDYVHFNNKPMFRYNTYFGIHTIHYMKLVETGGLEQLPLLRIVPAALLTTLARLLSLQKDKERILKPWAESLFNKLDALKFISFIDEDGYPNLIPLFQCQAATSTSLIFSPLAYSDELEKLKKGMDIAIFGLTMQMEDVLVRGTFEGFNSRFLFPHGTVTINWVYNSMPPKQGQIYPPIKVEPIRAFS